MKRTILFLIIPLFSFGQWTQIGSHIEAEASGDFLGTSVAINANGNIIAAGAPNNDGTGARPNSGHVRVYEDIAGTWTQIGLDINGENTDDESGTSIAMNGIGDIVAIGAPYSDENGNNSGHIRVYQNIAGTWTQLGNDIPGVNINDSFGISVTMNNSGTIVAGGSVNGPTTVHEYQGGTWVQLGNTINSINEAEAVTMDATGNILAIGYRYVDEVKVFENITGVWTEQTTIVGSQHDNFGASVSISHDGLTLAIGAPIDDFDGTYEGYAHVYRNSGGTWSQIGNTIEGVYSGDHFGTAVSVNSNGNIVAIGSHMSWDPVSFYLIGRVRVYQDVGGSWSQINDDIIDNNPVADAEDGYFGNALAISANGQRFVAGAPRHTINGDFSGEVSAFYNGNVLSAPTNQIDAEVSVFPNPTSGIITVNIEQHINSINITDLSGKHLGTFDNNSIDVSNLSNGIYILTIETDKGIFNQKIIKN